jgi:MSHA biogenesis protein MshJ
MTLPAPLANLWQPVRVKLQPLAERVDRLSLRERGLVFGAAIVLVFIAWQSLLMDPLAARARLAEQRLADARQRTDAEVLAGTAADQDPAVLAVARERALRGQLATLEAELTEASRGYVAPERMPELLRELLAGQRGLRLVSLRNLPVESLSPPPAMEGAAGVGTPALRTADLSGSKDRGPFLHPVEIVLDGDFGSIVAYMRALEGLPWRLHWRQLDMSARQYPLNRVRIEIGTLSLSRDWMTV